MHIYEILAVSGAIAWMTVAWWIYRQVKQSLARLRWALWGYRKRHKHATWPHRASDRWRGFRQRPDARETANHRPLS